jgi:hypothetical protein
MDVEALKTIMDWVKSAEGILGPVALWITTISDKMRWLNFGFGKVAEIAQIFQAWGTPTAVAFVAILITITLACVAWSFLARRGREMGWFSSVFIRDDLSNV